MTKQNKNNVRCRTLREVTAIRVVPKVNVNGLTSASEKPIASYRGWHLMSVEKVEPSESQK